MWGKKAVGSFLLLRLLSIDQIWWDPPVRYCSGDSPYDFHVVKATGPKQACIQTYGCFESRILLLECSFNMVSCQHTQSDLNRVVYLRWLECSRRMVDWDPQFNRTHTYTVHCSAFCFQKSYLCLNRLCTRKRTSTSEMKKTLRSQLWAVRN